MDVLPPSALARGFGALGRGLRLCGQRGDALIEPSGARVEILAAFAGLVGRAAARRATEGSRTQARATG